MKSIKASLLAIAIAGSSFAMAQTDRATATESARESRTAAVENREDKKAEIQRRKVAFIATELKLTPEESQNFWPVYNAYEAEKANFRDDVRDHWKDQRGSGEGLEPVNPDEMDRIMKERFSTERKRIDVDERYYERFKAVLPPEKVVGLYEAEREFKREIMRSMRERGPAQGQRNLEHSRRAIEGERQAPQREEIRSVPKE